MLRLRAALILIAVASECAFAQRGGAHSAQGYYSKPPNPVLNIDNQSTKTWSHIRLFRFTELEKSFGECARFEDKQNRPIRRRN